MAPSTLLCSSMPSAPKEKTNASPWPTASAATCPACRPEMPHNVRGAGLLNAPSLNAVALYAITLAKAFAKC